MSSRAQRTSSPVKLRHARRVDIPSIADVWVDAFTADPFFRWIQPDDVTWPAFGREWMTFIAELCFERGHTFIAEPLDLAIAWIPPDVAFVDAEGIQRGRGIIERHAGAAIADQALAGIMEARGHTGEESHWTLQYVGVRGGAQGKGLGAQASALGLANVDNDGLGCELISTNARNIPFYESLGFNVVAEVPMGDASAVMRPMRRSARV